MTNPDVINEGNSLISRYMERSHVLEYNESWNLLIPVIEKLTSEKFRATIHFNPGSSATSIYDPLNHTGEVQNFGTTDKAIRLAWKSVVEFIKSQQLENEIDE
jgi:hypothetical protein